MSKEVIPVERIAQTIVLLRGQKVMLDADLAQLYGVAIKALNQPVKRNAARFPHDFMFRLTPAEANGLIFQSGMSKRPPGEARNPSRSQTVTLKRGENLKYLPYVFTEQGVAMLSSVLRSERAVKVNIAIMRAFVRLRQVLESNSALGKKLAELELRVGRHDQEIGAIIDAIRQLMAPPEKAKREIGFYVRETAPSYRTRKKAAP
ncbi:MAG: ORF6N domain-containing protein [Chthoniobacterales bacterium]